MKSMNTRRAERNAMKNRLAAVFGEACGDQPFLLEMDEYVPECLEAAVAEMLRLCVKKMLVLKWDLNDSNTRGKLATVLSAHALNGVESWIVCDCVNNPPHIVDQNRLVVTVFLRMKPEYTRLKFTITMLPTTE